MRKLYLLTIQSWKLISIFVFFQIIFLTAPDVNAQTPVAWYPFTGDASDVVGTNHGTVNGATLTHDRFGNANSAYSFDGVDDNVSIAHNAIFNFSSYTISLWFKYNSPGTAGKAYWSLISKNNIGDGYQDAIHLWITENNKFTGGRIGGGGSYEVTFGGAPAINDGSWHQTTVVCDNANDEIRQYLDGILITSTPFTGNPFNNSANINIGFWEAYNNYFNGAIDEVKIYNTALTAAQVFSEYSSGTELPLPVPVVSGGTQGTCSPTNPNNMNGGDATGAGCGGGGAGYYGGSGGAGYLGGGGGGAAGFNAPDRTGGQGGNGAVAIAMANSNGTILSKKLFISGTTFDIPTGVTQVKVFAIGAGGGGAGTSGSDGTSGGGGGAGGMAFKKYTVNAGDVLTYSIGTGGAGGIDANNGSNGTATLATINGITITGNGGEGGLYNAGTDAAGGSFSGGDGGAEGGSGKGTSGDTGGGIAGGYNASVTCSGGIGANAQNVDILLGLLTNTITHIDNLPSLIAYYPLDGNAIDFSGNNLHGTIIGSVPGAADRNGNANSAVSFNGTTANRIEIDDNILLHTPSVTISAWVKLYSLTGIKTFVDKPMGNNVSDSWHLGTENSNFSSWYFNSPTDINPYSQVTSPATTGQWYYVVSTYDDTTKQHKLYIDGVLKTTNTFNSTIGYDNSKMYIGAAIENGGLNFPMDGVMDEVKVYNFAMTASQIRDELMNDLSVSRAGSGNALSFDGANDQILSTQQTQAVNNFTMEAWVKPMGTTTLHPQSTSGTSGVGGANQYLIFPAHFNFDGGAGIAVGTNGICVMEHGSSYLPVLLTWTGNIAGWNHIAVVYANKQPSLYVNGILVATGLQSTRENVYPTNSAIGGGAYGYYRGEADEIRIWDYPMTEEDIRDRMCRKITASDPKFGNLVTWFSFDESDVNIAFDLGGNGYDATLSNGPARVGSGAHIGNESVYNYVTAGWPEASLSYNNQDNLSVSYTSGTYTGQAGTHIYYVNEKPGSEAGIPNVGTNDRYFGVFSAGLSNPAYTATYHYNGNPYVTGSNESLLKLFKRSSNAESAWVSAQASLNIADKTLTAAGQSTEYMLGASADDYLAAWYPLDGNAQDSLGSNHGTIHGATPAADRFGNPDKAFLFDGLSNQITFSAPFTTLTNNYSFSAWVKPSENGGFILMNGQNSYPAPPPAPYNGTSMGITADHRLFGDHSGIANFTSNAVISDQDWNWVVFVRENGVSKLYINGLLQPNTTNSAPNTPAGGAFIGALTNSLGFFSGAIDDVKIYNKALTLTEIQQEMEQFVVDSRFGNHVKMNGSNDFINCGSDASLNITGALTVEAWVRPAAFTTVNQILQKGGTEGTQIDREGYQLRFDGGNSLGFTVSDAGSQDGIGMNVQADDLNRWMHVAATYDGTVLKIYRNGQLANQKTTSQVISHNNNPLLIGKRQDTWHFNGDIDEVRIWNVARTQEEIFNSLSDQLNGNETGLVGYWDMNREGQGQGLVVENKALATGSALNGTTNGTASTPVFIMTSEGDPGVIGGSQSICQTSVPAMLTSISPAAGIGTYPVFYQWQDSISNGNWNSIPGAVNATYQPDLLSQTTYFRRQATIGEYVGFTNVVTVDVIQITGDPEEFPQNEWNIYAYNGINLNLTGITYRGYYTANTVNIDTRNHWDQNGSPSQAAGYEGCSVPIDNFTFVMKRRGFPQGQYIINIPGHDDNIRIYVNGTQVFEYNGCCVSHGNITAGTLDENSTVEVRVIEGGGGAYAAINFVQTSLQPGVIAGNQNSCGSFTPSLLTSTQNAYGGETLTITYQWQDSIAGGAWNNIASAFNATYQPPVLSETRWYRRLAINGSETLPSNVIQITISYLAGDPAVFGENLWNIYAYNTSDINLGSAVYRGFYPVGSVNVDTRNQWDQNASPSSAAGYEGCLVNNDNFTFVMKRQGFAEGYYLMNIPTHDDGIRVYVNGQMVFEHLTCCDSHFNIPIGNLDGSSTVEIRCTEISGPGFAAVEFLLNPVILNYRSKASGNWSAASTWEVSDGGPWTDASVAPEDQHGTIAIRADHTVTINASVLADQLTVEPEGILVINSTLTLGYAPGDDLVVEGTLVLESATIQGAGSVVVTSEGIVNLNGELTKNLNTSFINNGDFNWNAGTIGYNNVLTNNGTMIINGNNDIQSWFNNLFFVNTGTIVKSSSGTTRFLYMNVQNNGTYTLNAGILRLEPGGQFQNNGLLTLNNSTLSNGGYTFSHNEGASIAGTGNFTTTGITLNASLVVAEGITFSSTGNIEGNGSLTINNDLSIQYNITGNGSLTIHGNINWISGTINRPLTINEGRTMTVSGSNDKNHNSPITNNGTINWQDGRLLQSAVITNNGVFNINGSSIFQRWFTEAFLVNNGTMVKNSAGTNTFDYMYVQNNPSGTIKGIGTINFTNGFQFISNGTIAPGTSPGILTINNAQPLSANSTLEIEMNNVGGPGTGHSQLLQNNNLTLNGKLRVIETGNVPNGTYIIIQLTSGTISGSFTETELPAGYELIVGTSNVALSRNAPSIACPADRVVSAPAGQCSVIVNNIDPAVEEGQSYTYTLSGATSGGGAGSASGHLFNAGVTQVTYALAGNPDDFCSFSVTVSSNVVPSVSISASATNICEGGNVIFTAYPVNGGNPSYQWKVNGENAGENSSVFETSSLTHGDVVNVVMVSSLLCASPSVATSGSITLFVNPLVTPAVTISTPSTEVCEDATVVFTASPVHGGNYPSYQWMVNGLNAGSNSPVFSTDVLNDGDVVSVVMTSNWPCVVQSTAVSNPIAMTIVTPIPASVGIAASANGICAGEPVTFTATPINGGANPSYQWRINGQNTGNNSPVFQSSNLKNGDLVVVLMTSGIPCAINPSFSNVIEMVVRPLPVVTISGSLQLCGTEPTTLTASQGVSYLWSTGATTRSISVSVPGNYSVTVTATNGCSNSATVSVLPSPQPVAQVHTLLPEDNSFGITQPITFSWTAADNATAYDLYIWRNTQTRPASPTVAGLTSTVHTYNQFLNTSHIYNWQVVARNSCFQAETSVSTFSFFVFTDLTVQPFSVQGSANSGDVVPVTFSVINTGSISTGIVPWKDDLYISTAPVFNINNAIKLASVNNLNPLIPGQSYTHTVNLTMPAYIEGFFYVFVKTDANSIIPETNENNNTVRSDNAMQVGLPPYPDLTVSNIQSLSGNLIPGQTVTVGWSVENIGDAPAVGGWSQRIAMVSGNQMQILGFVQNNETLPSSGVLTQSASFTIPSIPGFEGDVDLQVRLTPNAGLTEKPNGSANNTALSTDPVFLEKRLFVTLPQPSLNENTTSPMQAVISRSGNRSTSLTVNVSSSPDGRINTTQTVNIPANQSGGFFDVSAIDNSIFEGNTEVTISASGADYPDTTALLTLIDDEIPGLSMALSQTSATEGETFQLTITRSFVANSPLNMVLTAGKPDQITLPSSMVIPANEASSTIDILVISNTTPEISEDIVIHASAVGFSPVSSSIMILDDDVPQISLVINPSVVQENGGPHASWGTVQLTQPSVGNTVIQLSTPSSGQIYFPAQVTIPNGQMERQFNIGIVDNSILDGDRQAEVFASVFIPSCGCGAPAGTGGATSQSITILDNDGPSLSVAVNPFVVFENVVNAGVLTITRNTIGGPEISITIVHDRPSEIEVVSPVIMPQGVTSLDVPFNTLDDGITDGSQIVSVSVSAEEYSSGSCWVMVSDRNLPDFVATEVILSTGSVYINEQMQVGVRVTNSGFALAPAGAEVKIFRSVDAALDNSDVLLNTLLTPSVMEIGQTLELTTNFTPTGAVGDFFIIARINGNGGFSELIPINNTTSGTPLTVIPDYTATASVAGDIFNGATPILITGVTETVLKSPAPGKEVDIYILLNGTRRVLNTVSDNNGQFSVSFIPVNGEAGYYEIGACYPGQGLNDVQDSYKILGARAEFTGNLLWDIYLNETREFSIDIQNYSDLPLNNVKLQVVSAPPGCVLNSTPIPQLAGNGTATLTYSVTGNQISLGSFYHEINLQLTSDEGTRFRFMAWYYCQATRGNMKLEPVSLNKGMVVGVTTLTDVVIRNNGMAETGDITVALPQLNWLSLAGETHVIPSILPGQTAAVTLRLTPGADLPLNHPITGQIALTAPNANGVALPFVFEPISVETGSLLVDVVNEYTYLTAEAPHLEGASVMVTHPYTGQVIAQGVSDANGHFTAENINEGYYNLRVQAPRHNGFYGLIYVEKGRQNIQEIFLGFNAITYSWQVVPTLIEDEYEITLVAEFETNVPAPVLKIDKPKDMPELAFGEVYPFIINITNLGLITAKDVEVVVPVDDEYIFTVNANMFDLLPQTSIQIPALMQRKPGTKNSSVIGKCVDYMVFKYKYECGPDDQRRVVVDEVKYKGRHCTSTSAGEPICLDCFTAPAYSGGGAVGFDPFPFSIPTTANKATITKCNPCMVDALNDLIDDFPIPLNYSYSQGKSGITGVVVSTVKGTVEVVKDLAEDINKLSDAIDLLKSLKCEFDFQQAAGAGPGGGTPTAGEKELVRGLVPQEIITSITDVEMFLKALYAVDTVIKQLYTSETLRAKDAFYILMDSVAVELESLSGFTPDRISTLLDRFSQTEITADEITGLTSRWNTTMEAWDLGVVSPSDIYPDIADSLVIYQQALHLDTVFNYVTQRDFVFAEELYNSALSIMKGYMETPSSSVCATVTVQFSQTLTMTREAFEGTLTLYNGHETEAMQNIRLELEIRDEMGTITNDLFQINTKSLVTITGIDGAGVLDPETSGSAVILFIPERGAAPEVSRFYSFGGTLSYLDPFTLEIIEHPLFPVTLQVNPSPDLYIDYFMQRDILGDDALTGPIEPSIPAELAVIIDNRGFGNARNVKIESAQPEIIDNEKGLAIDFSIVGSNLGGKPRQLGLFDVDFGDISGGSRAVGQWWFTSSLLGHFIAYQVSVNHSNSFGNPDLSLVSEVNVHELIKGVRVYGPLDDTIGDFLVNDIPDSGDLPDRLYYSSGPVATVYQANEAVTDGLVTLNDLETELTVTPFVCGWNYKKIDDPGNGYFRIISITREDGQIIPLENVWLSFVTIPDGGEPIYENKLHFLDMFENAVPVSYTILWEAIDMNFPEVTAINGIPASGITDYPLANLEVVFNKPINPATFDYEEITLRNQGGDNLADETVLVSQVSDTVFNVDISSKTSANGFYAFTVQAAGIADMTGNYGQTGKQVSWIQAISTPAIDHFFGIPLDGLPTDTLLVLFNMPIEVSTFTSAQIVLAGPDGNQIPTGSLVITGESFNNVLFKIKGLLPLASENGTYTMTFLVTEIQGETGQAGLLDQTISWTVCQVPAPIAEIGPDAVICIGESYPMNGSVQNASGFVWTSSGTGTFDDPSSLTPLYTPGQADIIAGSVQLSLTALPLNDCATSVTDVMTLTIEKSVSANAGQNAVICQNGTHKLFGTVTHAGSFRWITSGNGIYSNSNLLTPVYTPGSEDKTNGFVTLSLIAEPVSPCILADTSSLLLTIQKLPTANAGPIQTVCQGQPVQLQGSAQNYSRVNWLGGVTGSLSDRTILNPVYTMSQTDVENGFVSFLLIAQPLNPCYVPANSLVRININKQPAASAGTNAVICEDQSHQLSATASNYSELVWSTSGDGSFSNANVLNPVYTPGLQDIQNGNATLTLVANAFSPCSVQAVSSLDIEIVNSPVAYAGEPAVLCEDQTHQLSGYVENAGNFYWTTSGDGSFDNPESLVAVYSPGVQDIFNRTVTLSLIAQPMSPCAVGDVSQLTLTLEPMPVVSAGSDIQICHYQSVILSGTVNHALSFEWSTGGDGVFDDTGSLNPTYTPGQGDINAGSVILTLSAVPLSPCSDPITDQITLQVYYCNDLTIPAGWSGLSTFVNPLDPAMEEVFRNVTGDLVILQSLTGLYWPEQSVNTIGNLSVEAGYTIKVVNQINLTITGLRTSNSELSLSQGWNLIPVLSQCEADVEALFDGTGVVVVKEAAGWQLYWPQYGINTLGSLQPGKAYYVLMSQPASVIFPDCNQSGAYSGVNYTNLKMTEMINAGPWNTLLPTPKAHLMAIPKEIVSASLIRPGDYLGAFDQSGNCYGMIRWEDHSASLALFADDPTTGEKDGFTDGEIFSLRIYIIATGQEYTLEVAWDQQWPDHNGTFSLNGLSAVAGMTLGTTLVNERSKAEIHIYPNPVGDHLFIDLVSQQEIEVVMTDIQGREVLRQSLSGLRNQLDLASLRSGIYMIKIRGSSFTKTERVIKK